MRIDSSPVGGIPQGRIETAKPQKPISSGDIEKIQERIKQEIVYDADAEEMDITEAILNMLQERDSEY